MIQFHIHHYHHYNDDVMQLLGKIMTAVDDLQAKANAVLAAVQADTNIDTAIAKIVDDNAQTIKTLQQQLADAGNDPAKLQQLSATMDAILQTDLANGKIVADKVTANTPADAPAPTPSNPVSPPAS